MRYFPKDCTISKSGGEMEQGKRVFCFLSLIFLIFALVLGGCSSIREAESPTVWQQESHNFETDNQSVEKQQTENQQTVSQVRENQETKNPEVESREAERQDTESQEAVNQEAVNQESKNQGRESKETGNQRIPILYYHSIAYEEGNELRIPPEEFEGQMQLLRRNGYESITLNDLYEHFYQGKEIPDKPIVITFDDGYEDNYLNAFPIAQKYGYKGTVFVVTDWIDGKGYLKREQLLKMSEAGWQIESHTRTHPYLTSLSPEMLEEELLVSKQVLEALLQEPVTAFAYPYGVYDYATVEACRGAGYLIGVTTERGWAGPENPFLLQRVYCYAQMGQDEFLRRIENPNY